MPKLNLLAARLPQTQMSCSSTADVKLQVQFLGEFRLHRARAHVEEHFDGSGANLLKTWERRAMIMGAALTVWPCKA